MKRKHKTGRIILSALLSVLFISALILSMTKDSISGTSAPGVKETRHDLSYTTGPGPWQYQTSEVCVFCHTPHQGRLGETPLWNRSLSPSTFTMYTSSTFNMGPASSIGSPSSLCMSCHDGTMAMNALTNTPGRGSTGTVAPFGSSYTRLEEVYYPGSPWGIWPNISGSYSGNTSVDNLADEHPISFTYASSADRQGNNFPAPSNGAITGAYTGTKYPLYGANKDQFECSTCHDVHDTADYSTKDVSEVFFLRTSNEGSSMCRDCHTTKF